jgi:hypothetical protein
MTGQHASETESAEFLCSETDFLEAQRLHHRVCALGRRFLVKVFVASLVVSSLVFFYIRYGTTEKSDFYSIAFAAISFVFYISVILLSTFAARWILLPRQARRQLSQIKEFRGVICVEIKNSCITFITQTSRADVPPGDFLKWAESDHTIALYRSDLMFHLIPKRVITQSFHDRLVAELIQAGVPKASFSNS